MLFPGAVRYTGILLVENIIIKFAARSGLSERVVRYRGVLFFKIVGDGAFFSVGCAWLPIGNICQSPTSH